jgi:FMN phosphatase YigB (HAD superfamily)
LAIPVKSFIMARIKAILIDIGGVLWHPIELPLHVHWAARCGLSPKEFDEIVYNSEWGAQALLGTITGEEMWQTIGNKLGLSPKERSQCEDEYWAGVWDTEFLDYCRVLKSRCKLGIVSDAESTTREKAKPWVNESLFDTIVFSAEVGVCEPHSWRTLCLYRHIAQRGMTGLLRCSKPTTTLGDRSLGPFTGKTFTVH